MKRTLFGMLILASILPVSAYSAWHLAADGEAPGAVAILKELASNSSISFDLCSGTLISENYVLTAQHCMSDSIIIAPNLDITSLNKLRNLIQSVKTLEEYKTRIEDYITEFGAARVIDAKVYRPDEFEKWTTSHQAKSEFFIAQLFGNRKVKLQNAGKYDIAILKLDHSLKGPFVKLSQPQRSLQDHLDIVGYGEAKGWGAAGSKVIGQIQTYRVKKDLIIYPDKDGNDLYGEGFSGGAIGKIQSDGSILQYGVISGNRETAKGYKRFMSAMTDEKLCWIQSIIGTPVEGCTKATHP